MIEQIKNESPKEKEPGRKSMKHSLKIFRLQDNKKIAYASVPLGAATGLAAYYGNHMNIPQSILFGWGYHTLEFYMWLVVIKKGYKAFRESNKHAKERFKILINAIKESRKTGIVE